MANVMDELRRLSRDWSSPSTNREGKDSPGNYAKVLFTTIALQSTFLRYLPEMYPQPRRYDVWLLTLRSRTLPAFGGF